MNNINVPKIRLKGFDKEWKRDKMEALATFSKGRGYTKNDLSDSGTPIILYGRLYTKYETVISNIDTFVIKKEGSVLSKGGEVIVPASGETPEDIARGSVVSSPNIVLGGDLNIVYPNKNINSIFLALSISNGTVWSDLCRKSQGKSVVHLRNTDLSEVDLNFPHFTEQSQIGSFFQNIDSLITTQQNKISKLKNIKSACLDKMFPKKGSNTPEIRFKGFSGEWEEKMLKEECIITTGFPFDSNEYYKDGKYLVITNGNIQDETMNVDNSVGNKIDIEDSHIIDSYVLNIGDVLITMDGTVGRIAKVNNPNLVLAQRVGRISSNDNNNFIYHLLDTGDFFKSMSNISTGGTIKHISLDNIGSYVSMFPKNFNERIVIGDFFDTLNDHIMLSINKLTKLKNIKTSFLNKMFVSKE